MSEVPRLVHEFGPDTAPGSGPDGGPVAAIATSPVTFRGRLLHAAKVAGHEGDRTVGAAQLLARIGPAMRVAGITRLADITGLDDLGVPVTLAIRPNGATLSTSAGKGLTRDAALASAAMEALELHHAEEWAVPTEQLTYAEAFRDLDAPPPDRLPLTGWGLFRHDRPLAWVRGWDIAGGAEVGLPAAMVRMGDRRGQLDSLHAFQVTSNGLASSTTLVEAVHSGLLEVVERDAVTCWRYRRDSLGELPPAVATTAFRSGVVNELVDRLARRDTRVLVLDTTVDTAVPVYTAFLFSGRGVGRGVYKGFGAHLDPVAAVLRAITEACQSRAVHIAGSRDDMFRHRISGVADTAVDIAGLERMHADAHRDATEPVAGPESAVTFEADIATVLSRLAAVGLDQVVVVDLGTDHLPVSVAKVVVPGMEGYLVENHTPGHRARMLAGEVAS